MKTTMSTRPLGWTTLEESERLVMAGLDSNTADMMYYQTPQDVLDPNNGVSTFGILLNLYPDFNGLKKNMEQFYSGYNGPVPIFFKPCWSLGKLADLMPKRISDKGFGFEYHLENYEESEIEVEYHSSQCHRTIEWWHGEVMIEVFVDALAWLSEHGHIEKPETK